METLAIVLMIFALVFFVLAIVGLVKPSLVKQTSRIKAFLIFGVAAFVCFMVMGGIVANEQKNPNSAIEDKAPTTKAEPVPEPVVSPAPVVEEKPQVPDETKNPHANFNAVVETLRNDFKLKVAYNFGDKFCPQSNYCEAIVDGIHVTAIGHIVDAKTSIKVSPKTYQTVCAGILTALSGANSEVAWAMNKQAFDFAAQNGRADTELGGVSIKIRPDSSTNLLQCQYVKVIR